MIMRDKVQGARNAETEIVCVIQRGCEALYYIFRATPQFARRITYQRILNKTNYIQ